MIVTIHEQYKLMIKSVVALVKKQKIRNKKQKVVKKYLLKKLLEIYKDRKL